MKYVWRPILVYFVGLWLVLAAQAADPIPKLSIHEKNIIGYLELNFPIKFHFYDTTATNPYDRDDGTGKVYRCCEVEYLKDINGRLGSYQYGSSDSESFLNTLESLTDDALSAKIYYKLNKPHPELSENAIKYMNAYLKAWFETDQTDFLLRWGETAHQESSLTEADQKKLDEIFPERHTIRQQIKNLNESLKIVRERYYHP